MFMRITKLGTENKKFSLTYELDDTFTDSQKSQLSGFCNAVAENKNFSDIIIKLTDKL